ncbi:sodium/proline symporter PutP [Sutcliffiella rhizosphaerae]|uniref:Sodium/proline symporter n=1 Tax=Sutcliffiella rhizosphaerae TaxID=2880967 RepID=A0ABN8A864_9BACI|nr:sodium/proline symporter PutP [Sutcliffiella rhizosphaerae]CAG9621339.1 Osmoregulated proline transporter OpuE [Sutcliffiella rhizosphaerae]
METGVFISIGLYFIAMLAIGFYAYKKSTDDISGYMLGGRKLGPGVTALSAGASDMSGWMMMGLPGAMYVSGVSSVWIAVGLTIGAYLNYIILAPRLRVYTETANDSITIPDFFENRFFDESRILRFVSAIVIIIFFTLYTSAGMVSGGTLFDSAFGVDYTLGLFLVAGVTIAYTLFGGFLGASLTDFVQGTIMLLALVIVPLVALTDLGGPAVVLNEVRALDPSYLDLFKGTTVLGIISLLAWGLGYFGQPHIIVRFMAIRSIRDLKTARRIGISWMAVTIIGAMSTGFVGIAYVSLTDLSLVDPETVFIVFSQLLFNPLVAGFLLAAILAAIMSTVSSQLLVTSSALTEDFYKTFLRRQASDKELVTVGRICVLLVSIVAILLSLTPSDTILNLVGNAWAGFGSAFGPVIVLSLYWKRMNQWGALAGMLVGTLTVLIWIYGPFTIGGERLTDVLYEMIPGFFLSTLAIIIVSLLTNTSDKKVQDGFSEMEEVLANEQNK